MQWPRKALRPLIAARVIATDRRLHGPLPRRRIRPNQVCGVTSTAYYCIRSPNIFNGCRAAAVWPVRRMRVRYDRSSECFDALVLLACTVICFDALQPPPWSAAHRP